MVFSFCVAYVGFRHFKTPLPKYYPTLHQWSVKEPPVKAPGMGWYALFGASLACSLLFAGVAGLAARAFLDENKTHEGLIRIASALTTAAIFFMIIFNILHEYHEWIVKGIK